MANIRVLLHQDGECGCGCGCGSSSSYEEEALQEWKDAPDDRIVCHCAEVSKGKIVETIRNGAYTAPLVKVLTGLGRGRPCPNDNGCVTTLNILLKLYGQTTLTDAFIPIESE